MKTRLISEIIEMLQKELGTNGDGEAMFYTSIGDSSTISFNMELIGTLIPDTPEKKRARRDFGHDENLNIVKIRIS